MSSPGGELRVTKIRSATSVWNTTTRNLTAVCANGMFTFRSRYSTIRTKRCRSCWLCTATPAPVKSTQATADWYNVAEKHGFIVVFPSALHAKVNMPEQGLMPDWAPLNAWNVFLEDDRSR